MASTFCLFCGVKVRSGNVVCLPCERSQDSMTYDEDGGIENDTELDGNARRRYVNEDNDGENEIDETDWTRTARRKKT